MHWVSLRKCIDNASITIDRVRNTSTILRVFSDFYSCRVLASLTTGRHRGLLVDPVSIVCVFRRLSLGKADCVSIYAGHDIV